MDHVFTLVMNHGWHGELCRMKPDTAQADAAHNFALLSASAAKRSATVVWTRGEYEPMNPAANAIACS